MSVSKMIVFEGTLIGVDRSLIRNLFDVTLEDGERCDQAVHVVGLERDEVAGLRVGAKARVILEQD